MNGGNKGQLLGSPGSPAEPCDHEVKVRTAKIILFGHVWRRWGTACGKPGPTQAGTLRSCIREKKQHGTRFILLNTNMPLYYLDFFPICHIPVNVYTTRKINQQWKQLTKSADNSVPS